MPFKKGQSGNPGGRPHADFRIKDLAKEYTEDALKTLAEICSRGENEGARVAAAEALLNRGWGKPAQAIVGSDDPDDAPLRLSHTVEWVSDTPSAPSKA